MLKFYFLPKNYLTKRRIPKIYAFEKTAYNLPYIFPSNTNVTRTLVAWLYLFSPVLFT